MERLLEKIDKYIEIQEKKEAIALSTDDHRFEKDIIEMVKNS
jgi:hypothetical protein